jgi:serine/threonine-protein kinase RsbT
MPGDYQLSVESDADIVDARAQARRAALDLGFSNTDATLIATAISEIARNLLVHAGGGDIRMRAMKNGVRNGLEVEARDDGPGILDVDAALGVGYAGRGGLGLGLPGARRLMDDFTIETTPESGTVVRMSKWRVIDELERLRTRRRRDAGEGRKRDP